MKVVEDAKATEEATNAEEYAKADEEAKNAEKSRKTEEAKKAKEARKAERAKKAEAARRKIMEADQPEASENNEDPVAEEAGNDTPNGLRKVIKRIPRAEYEASMSNNAGVQEEQPAEEAVFNEKTDAVDTKEDKKSKIQSRKKDQTKT